MLQEFDLEIKDKKESKNLVVDHLSRLVNEEFTSKGHVCHTFSDEVLLVAHECPWFTDMANYKAIEVISEGINWQQKKIFLRDTSFFEPQSIHNAKDSYDECQVYIKR